MSLLSHNINLRVKSNKKGKASAIRKEGKSYWNRGKCITIFRLHHFYPQNSRELIQAIIINNRIWQRINRKRKTKGDGQGREKAEEIAKEGKKQGKKPEAPSCHNHQTLKAIGTVGGLTQ